VAFAAAQLAGKRVEGTATVEELSHALVEGVGKRFEGTATAAEDRVRAA
jgi:hypothetical protein